MNDDKEFIEFFERAKKKFELAVFKYPLEMHEISTIIEKSDDIELSEVQQAFKKLNLILDEINSELNN
jgi:uncharacterized membrane protein